jgi:hypothetical protein
MARGWESKGVESQQEDARRRQPAHAGPPPTAEQRARAVRQRSLELALARARADRERASAPAHIALLDRTIEALEHDLRSLTGEEKREERA